jgi:chemotaxis methyl-accepting protein methylase
MSETVEQEAFLSLTEKISRDSGFACASYKDRCLRRRIAVRMRARGVHSYADYEALLESDNTEYELLLEALTINVTKLFRNPEVFAAIEREVVPHLWNLPQSAIRIWSAGCASGEEPYSLAIAFARHAQSRGDMKALSRVHVLGTDIDRASLAHAALATYQESAFSETVADIRDTYFSEGYPARVRDDIRRMVEFRQADLFVDEPLLAPYHLIVCRNVIIYFDRDSQERLFARFHRQLAPGGFLVLGKVETILGEARSLFLPVDSRERVFRRR